jgi:hypothetical protein
MTLPPSHRVELSAVDVFEGEVDVGVVLEGAEELHHERVVHRQQRLLLLFTGQKRVSGTSLRYQCSTTFIPKTGERHLYTYQ